MIGGCTRLELSERMDAEELQDWVRYARKMGGVSPHRRLERLVTLEFAKLRHTLVALNTPKGKRVPPLSEFLPEPEYEDSSTGDAERIQHLFNKVGGSSGDSGIRYKRKKRGA